MDSPKVHYCIGSRKSKLAMIQTREVMSKLQSLNPSFSFQIQEQETKGDKILDVALSKIGDKGLFTQELEDDLKSGKIDFAVHSLKDLPTRLPDGLVIGCILERVIPTDVLMVRSDLVKKGYNTLADLNNGPAECHIIGTSSLRRQSQIQHQYSNLNCVDIRGNLDTRIKKLENEGGEFPQTYAAIVLAWAGLVRQGETYTSRVTQRFTVDQMYYAVGQGALAVECRAGDVGTLKLLSSLHHTPTANSCLAERQFLRTLEGGCHAPIGVSSKILETGNLQLKGIVLSLDGKKVVKDQIEGSVEEAETLGNQLALNILKNGADVILASISGEQSP